MIYTPNAGRFGRAVAGATIILALGGCGDSSTGDANHSQKFDNPADKGGGAAAKAVPKSATPADNANAANFNNRRKDDKSEGKTK